MIKLKVNFEILKVSNIKVMVNIKVQNRLMFKAKIVEIRKG